MSPPLSLPDDLTDAERAEVERARMAAARAAEQRAAERIVIRRAVDRLRASGLPVKAVFHRLADDRVFPMQPGSIENAYRGKGRWAA